VESWYNRDQHSPGVNEQDLRLWRRKQARTASTAGGTASNTPKMAIMASVAMLMISTSHLPTSARVLLVFYLPWVGNVPQVVLRVWWTRPATAVAPLFKWTC